MLKKWRNDGYHLNYGSDAIKKFSSIASTELNKKINILDIGSDDSRDLDIIDNHVNDFKNGLFAISEQKSIPNVFTKSVDVESNELPFENNFFEITISNQVYEHLKNWLWAFHEQIRVTKKNGWAIVGFPNLAALHCRIQLSLGHHPSCIKLDDAHVRGFTKKGFVDVINKINGLSIKRTEGSNMYGFPPRIARILGKTFPGLAVSIFFLIKKNETNINVIDIIKLKELQTTFFTGR